MEIKTHPIYNLYEFNTNGEFRRIGKNEWKKGNLNGKGYYICSIIGDETKQQCKLIHRCIWETFKGTIPEGYEIDHLDSNKQNNKLVNLECVTKSENAKRGHKNRKVKNWHVLRRYIKSINLDTKEELYFFSKSQAGKKHGCNPALIYFICEGLNNVKTFNGNIKFEYCDDVKDLILKDPRKGKSKYKTEEEKKEAKRNNAKKYRQKKLEKINKV